ncbi:WD40 repeat-like protein [Meredithblackwellia eburnea MCA 4105]
MASQTEPEETRSIDDEQPDLPGSLPRFTIQTPQEPLVTRRQQSPSTWSRIRVPTLASIPIQIPIPIPRVFRYSSTPTKASQTETDYNDHSDTSDDEDGPLDGEEGIVVDDEACFVEERHHVDFLSSLPHEISLYIILHLNFQDLLSISLVSKQWSVFAQDNLVWRDLFHRESRWRVRENYPLDDLPPSSPSALSNSGFLRRESTTSTSTSSRIPTPTSTPSSSHRISRRFSEMMADLGSLSLSPIARRNSSAIPSPPPLNHHQNVPSATDPFHQAAPSLSRSHSLVTTPTIPTPTTTPTRRPSSSSTLPPLGPVPSPSLHTTPSAPLSLNWALLFRDRWTLERRWELGKAKTFGLKGHGDSVYCAQMDSTGTGTGRRVISGGRDRTIKIWDLPTRTCLRTISGHHEGSILCLQFDDRILVTGSSDCRIIVWEDKSGSAGKGKYVPVRTLVGHSMGVLDLCFDDEWIVSCSKDTTIRVWSRATGALHRVLSGHSGPVNAVQLLKGKIYSASGDSLLKVWSISTGEVERIFAGHERGLACAQLSPSGKLVATGSNDTTVKVWDTATGNCLLTLVGHTDLVRSLAFDEVRRRIVSASYDRTIRLWDLDDGQPLLRFRPHTSLVFDVRFDCSRILSCSHDQRIVVQDFGEGLDVSKFL